MQVCATFASSPRFQHRGGGQRTLKITNLLIAYFVCLNRELGKGALISSFSGSQCVLRKGDGSEVVARVSPYPLVLHQLLAQHHWDKATKLCHAVKVNLSIDAERRSLFFSFQGRSVFLVIQDNVV